MKMGRRDVRVGYTEGSGSPPARGRFRAWCYEPVHKSGPDIVPHPKLLPLAQRGARRADCSSGMSSGGGGHLEIPAWRSSTAAVLELMFIRRMSSSVSAVWMPPGRSAKRCGLSGPAAPERLTQQLVKRLESLGHKVILQPQENAA